MRCRNMSRPARPTSSSWRSPVAGPPWRPWPPWPMWFLLVEPTKGTAEVGL